MENLIWSGFYKHIDFNIDYDFYEPYEVKQNDTHSRGLYVQIIQNGLVITPSASNSLTFFAVKPDGTKIFAPGVIENGLFRVDFPNQALSVAGQMKGELALRGANNEVITKSITVTIEPSLELQGVESTDDFTALQQALSQITGFAGEIQDVQLFAEVIKANLGELENLDTVDKENIVAAINEVNSKISNILNSEDLELLLNTKVDKDTLGDMSQLATDEKTVLVTAMNELFNSIEEVKEVSNVSTLLPLLNSKAEKTTVGNLADLVDFEDPAANVNNLVQAINYVFNRMNEAIAGIGDINLEGLALSEDLGDKTTLTTTDKTNLVNAINEINAALKTVESVTDVEQLSLLLSGKADKSSLGNLSELTTTQKNNLVAAINEVNAQIGDVDLSEIFTLLEGKVSQEDFDTAVTALQSNIDAIELTPGPQGPPGQDGQPGQPGADGQDGLSAYQIWLDAGNTGTEQDFLDSLEGPQGPPGESAEGPGESDVELSYTGKVLISSAINDKGVNASYEDTFVQLADKVRSIETPITIGLRDLSNAFAGTQADIVDLRFVDTSRLWNANRMFLDANIGVLDISMNNLGDLTDVQYMFSGANIGEIKVKYQDTNLVTNCTYMFSDANIGGSVRIVDIIDTRNVTNMISMFQGSQATTLDLSSFNTSNVTNMNNMFQDSQATTLDLSSFDTSKVNSMMSMFHGSQATTLDLSSFDTSNVTVMAHMFNGSQATTLDLSSFDTSKVNSMNTMFQGSQATTLDLSSFDTSRVNLTSMRDMFLGSQATTGYARTQADADKFNASSGKPADLTFIVKLGL